jgi:hypothetical protein
MSIANLWTDTVSDETMSYLERSINRRVCSLVKHPWTPNEVERTIATKKYSVNGLAIFEFAIVQGMDTSRNTRPRKVDNVDIFWYDVFLNIEEYERIAILIHADPFSEFSNLLTCQSCFTEFYGKEIYGKTLGIAMKKLQRLSEIKKLVTPMNIDADDGLWTWASISKYLRRSIPTTMKMAKQDKLPIIYMGGIAYTTKSQLDKFLQKKFQTQAYWQVKDGR